MEGPRVGVGVIVKKDGKILIGKRLNAHGEGTWCFPGGNLEFFEDLYECAKRETFEETGVKIKNIKLAGITNDLFEKENLHYITVFFEAEWAEGEAAVKESRKFVEVKWVKWNEFPEKIFKPTKNLRMQGYKPGFD